MQRTQSADLTVARLHPSTATLAAQWAGSGAVQHAVIDELLPGDLANAIRAKFPLGSDMRTRKGLRELKHIAAQMDHHDPLREEILFAFQDPRVVALVGKITGLQALEPDERLYAGGIARIAG